MTKRKKSSFSIIMAALVVLTFSFIVFGAFYESSLVGQAEYKAEIVDSISGYTGSARDVNAKLFRLKKGKYLLILAEVGGRRTEGYYVDMSDKKLGYAKFSADMFTSITSSMAMVDKVVFTGYRIADELDADFQILSDGAVIAVKGPSELAVALNSNAERIYKNRLIYRKTILLGH